MSKADGAENSLRERPTLRPPRRLADWLNPTGAVKVHSLVDKVYQLKNLELAWERVRRNAGAGGVDGVSVAAFEQVAPAELIRLHHELREDRYVPQPVRVKLIPKAGQPGKFRQLGIPSVYDRVCQQALRNRLEPIFEPVFDDASFGYRPGRSAKDALRRVWRALRAGQEWIVDADLRDFFGSCDHEKLLVLVNQRVSDGRVLGLIRRMLQAGMLDVGSWRPSDTGVPQGGVISPLLSNILLTPFDRELRRKDFHLTRYADDCVVTCRTRDEAEFVLAAATRVLAQLGVELNAEKTRIVHLKFGFEFLGYKLKSSSRAFTPAGTINTVNPKALTMYAYPRQKSIAHFKDQIRRRTRRKSPLRLPELIGDLNPVIRGWGLYYCKAHVRKLFNRLDRWIIRRIWSNRYKRWKVRGWRTLPMEQLHGPYRLVNLLSLIPSLTPRRNRRPT